MKIESRILIISLIFVSVLYTVLILAVDYFVANSFLAGALISIFDLYALTRLIRTLFATGTGWLFVPIGVLRWVMVAVALVMALYIFRAAPLALLAGVSVPFICVFLETIYKLLRGRKDGASS